ncbi:error-prone DNA polymerase [Pseudokordiimonas caeni]|uniref:error-prone DNA polymerase n=1 Tax=Pseudokordiimonas caeni TaxID=2997908 RepID=UPI00281109E5|nr:error-prone DNA polymerase [Pseudokordiimonas caeni]
MADYAELQVTSAFSFMRGASHPDELVLMAKALGLKALALVDRNSVAGLVRAHKAAKMCGMPFIPGCRLDLMDAPSLLVWPTDRAAWGRLTALLTLGNRRAEKGECHLTLDDVAAHATGLHFAMVPEAGTDIVSALRTAREALDMTPALVVSPQYDGRDRRRFARMAALAREAGARLLATGDVRYHIPERRPLLDILTCVREHVTIDTAGYRLAPNAERFLRPGFEMARLFAGHPEALQTGLEIAEACPFSLDELRYNYPNEPVPPGMTAQAQLETLARDGIEGRYPDGVPPAVRTTLEHELALIGRLGFAAYFLTVHDIVAYARSQHILCQGRGSAANSVVCYALRVTDVDPTQVDLLFERFISEERGEPPDIDVDFEHERREEVIQYIYARYGRHRAALAATLITWRARSAIREVGKAMGLSEDTVAGLAGTVWGSYGREIPDEQVMEAGFDPTDARLRQTLDLAHELMGFPRHLSQHVGGFVLTEDPLDRLVPIQNAAMADRTVIEWDKDDIDALGILKVDVLALGMLSCLRRGFAFLKNAKGLTATLATLPKDDTATYDMLCKADSIGVFQVESRAQMSMLPRLRPRKFYDLVVQVAIVRPGPIQGGMVNPYLRRRMGRETIDYPSPAPEHGPPDELRHVLSKTMGVPLFQEQAMKIAIVAAGFTPGEADGLRRAMATFKNSGTVGNFRERFTSGMTRRGYTPDFADRCFKQIEGFADYGFPESHAASFAHLAYASAWMKCHHPDVFAAALLNSQPMGFYAAAQIVRDAVDHGVEVRAADVNLSDWDSTLEAAPGNGHGHAVRLGLRQIEGFREDTAERIMATRHRAFRDLADLQARARLTVAEIEKLAEADACRSMGLDRRAALWAVRGLSDAPDLPLFRHADTAAEGAEEAAILPVMPVAEHVVADYQTLRLSLKAHPLSFLRSRLQERGVTTAMEVRALRDGAPVTVAGLVLVRQRPGTAKGVIFVTLEDETGVVNVVVWAKVFEAERRALMGSRLMVVKGRVQFADDVLHVVADHLTDASADLLTLSDGTFDLPAPAVDEARTGRGDDPRLPRFRPAGHPRAVRDLIPQSRDFH